MIIEDTTTNMYVTSIKNGFVATHGSVERAMVFQTVNSVYEYIAKNDTFDTIRLGLYVIDVVHYTDNIADWISAVEILNDVPPYIN